LAGAKNKLATDIKGDRLPQLKTNTQTLTQQQQQNDQNFFYIFAFAFFIG
jgi:hypothetical protein